MSSRGLILLVILLLALAGGWLVYTASGDPDPAETKQAGTTKNAASVGTTSSNREIMTTDGEKHSIPLDDILSGGPGKDGIPSIDEPRFSSADAAAEWLKDDNVGLGITVGGESRFYPYRILVWHEIVNDTIQGKPTLVTYCPLCRTGIVFERSVNGEPQEFGVSGKLWKSNLLMYNRAGNPDNESYWSQVLGEAVVGPHTGIELAVIESDTMTFGAWRELHPETKVLTRETGSRRDYTRDPYEGYYDSSRVSFGAEFDDERAHPKAMVLGVELGGEKKAYPQDELPIGTTTDTVGGTELVITKSEAGEVRMRANGSRVSYIRGFWFSWLAAHPDTAFWQGQ